MTEAERRARERKLKELRKALQEEFGKAAASPALFKVIEGKGIVQEWLNDTWLLGDVKEEVELLLEYRQDVLEQHGARPGPPARGGSVEVELNERESELAAALSAYLAWSASVLPEVQEYRKGKFSGANERLGPKEVVPFLQRELIEAGEDKEFVLSLSLGDLLSEVSNSASVASFDEAIFPTPTEGLTMLFRDEQLSLGDLSAWLAACYPWSPEDAAWFVLTGEPPEVVSLSLSYHPLRRSFTMQFAPWISETTFRRVYRKARDQAYEAENRQPSKKALTILRFVTENAPPEKTPEWTKLMRKWNEDTNIPTEWRFKNVSGFRKTFLSAERKVAAPWMDLP